MIARRPTTRRAVVTAIVALVCCVAGLGAAFPGPAAPGAGPRRTVELASGVRYVDLEVGEGRPARRGRMVTVHLLGTLPDGRVVVSTRQSGHPTRFRLGDGKVIAGVEEGMLEMRVGGRREITVPPGAAYGQRGVGEEIPPGATLTFEVDLLQVD